MKVPCMKFFRNPAAWLAALFCLVVIFLILAEPALITGYAAGQAQRRQMGSAANPKVKVGEYPPDFELPILTLGRDKEGNPFGLINDKKTIRLSSFRGERPVCVIMSSYT